MKILINKHYMKNCIGTKYVLGLQSFLILKESNIILLDLEVNGATKLLSENDDFIGIFIDIDDNELVKRLKNRGHDEDFINKRMQLASIQREKKSNYQYHVDNVDIKSSVNQILDIIYALEES